MTRDQLSVMISSLLGSAERGVKTSMASTDPAGAPTWIANMTASLVCSALVDALIAARDELDKEDRRAPRKAPCPEL